MLRCERVCLTDDGRPCKRRRRDAGIGEQLRDVNDDRGDMAADVHPGGQWDGAHGGLGGACDLFRI